MGFLGYLALMSSSGVLIPVVPGKLRPGQLGVVMIGRVIMGDIAVTLVDLCVRKLIQIEQVPGGDWLLRPGLASAPRQRRESLLGYEQTLLNGLAHKGESIGLTSLAGETAPLLDATRSAIVHEAVHRGWLRHLHHQERTSEGEELAGKIRAFQWQLRHFLSDQGHQAVPAELLPYALHFGFIARDHGPLAGFAHAWVEVFADLPGWRTPGHQRPSFDDGPLLTGDEEMSGQLGNALFLLGT